MRVETDEEFEALVRARFAAKPYQGWNAAMYEDLVQRLLTTQRFIRAATAHPPDRRDDLSPDVWDEATVKWALWAVANHDTGAQPTPWHRIAEAARALVQWTRSDERRRIAQQLRDDMVKRVGPTAADLITSAIQEDGDC